MKLNVVLDENKLIAYLLIATTLALSVYFLIGEVKPLVKTEEVLGVVQNDNRPTLNLKTVERGIGAIVLSSGSDNYKIVGYEIVVDSDKVLEITDIECPSGVECIITPSSSTVDCSGDSCITVVDQNGSRTKVTAFVPPTVDGLVVKNDDELFRFAYKTGASGNLAIAEINLVSYEDGSNILSGFSKTYNFGY